MRVGFNARYMRHPSRRGFNRYTYSLAKALTRQEDVEVVLISEDPVHESFLDDLPVEAVAVRGVRHWWWEQAILPRLIGELRLDIFHAPGSIGLPLRKVCAYVLTVHDAIGRNSASAQFFPRQSLWLRAQYRSREWVALRRADAIITVSAHAKADIVDSIGVAPDRLTVIAEAAEDKFCVLDPEVVSSVTTRYGLERPYIFYVGGFDARKNVPTLVAAYARSRARHVANLVLAGEHMAEGDGVARLAAQLGVGPRIKFTGYVSDDDLPALYNGACLFVYPSLYEGFGLQLAEAMACGVPVVASNRSSIPEVLSGAGILIDPENVAAMADAIDAVVFDDATAQRLRQRGLDVARHLSWDRTALDTLRVYRDVLART